MPIYEYQCDACGNQFEELLLGSEPDPEVCPECGKPKVRRVMSNTSFQLKGGGWYVTDYGSSGSTKASPTASSETSSEPSSGSDSSDSSGGSGSDDSSAA